MSLWICPDGHGLFPNGNYHCPECGTPMQFAIIASEGFAGLPEALQPSNLPSVRLEVTSGHTGQTLATKTRSIRQGDR
jgi:hypothetical protein